LNVKIKEWSALPSKPRVAGSSPAAPTRVFKQIAQGSGRKLAHCDVDCDVTFRARASVDFLCCRLRRQTRSPHQPALQFLQGPRFFSSDSASRRSVVSSASRYRTPWTATSMYQCRGVCRSLLSSTFLAALWLAWPALWVSTAKDLAGFAGLREMLGAVQGKCSCPAFLAHRAGGGGQRIRFLGFHIQPLYYKRLLFEVVRSVCWLSAFHRFMTGEVCHSSGAGKLKWMPESALPLVQGRSRASRH